MPNQDKLEEGKLRKQPAEKRKRRGKKKKKTWASAGQQSEGESPQKPHSSAKNIPSEEEAPEKNSTNATLDPTTPNLDTAEFEDRKLPQINTQPLAQPPSITTDLAAMSPRKQTLLRHKKSSDMVAEPSFISEAKEYRKNRRQPQLNVLSELVDDDQKYLMLLSQQNLEGKASLFRCLAARILVYHEQIQDPVLQSSSGTLLGHGELEIFQLHNGDVTYMACGRSFVYPLLPKLKILRINMNQFILPLSNPERYWKINIDSEDVSVIKELELVLQKVVKYTNLSFAAANSMTLQYLDTVPENAATGEADDQPNENNSPQTPERQSLNIPNIANNNLPPSTLHAGHVERTPKASQFTPFFNDIPESPPSAPISPQQFLEPSSSLDLLPINESKWPLHRQKSNQSITSALASFNVTEDNDGKKFSPQRTKLAQQKIAQPKESQQKMAQPKPLRHPHANPHADVNKSLLPLPYKQHSNPYHSRLRPPKADARSDSSSMDSLLDEYEENISTTKSINYNIPRSQSRTMSLASSAYPPAINYQRGKIPLVPDIRSNLGSVTHEVPEDDPDFDDFPKTSLSQYNRRMQNTHSQRSRRSSPSELYNSVSNWMEPNVPQYLQLSHSRSNYSLASAKNSIKSNRTQENTLRDIYRSITENNLHAAMLQPNGRRPSITSSRGYGQRLKTNGSLLQHPSDFSYRRGEPHAQKVSSLKNGKGRDSLSSSDVYRLVSSRNGRNEVHNGESKRGGISRLFGC